MFYHPIIDIVNCEQTEPKPEILVTHNVPLRDVMRPIINNKSVSVFEISTDKTLVLSVPYLNPNTRYVRIHKSTHNIENNTIELITEQNQVICVHPDFTQKIEEEFGTAYTRR